MFTREYRVQLRADIAAVTTTGGHLGESCAYGMQTHPAILRRVAALLSEALPATVDRIVATAPIGVPLATAMALHTGLPFAFATVTDTGRLAWTGAIRAGESVAVVDPVITGGDRVRALFDAIEDGHATAAGVYAVFCDESDGLPVNALFAGTGGHDA
jgi:orotate phosphoribosyltransferase